MATTSSSDRISGPIRSTLSGLRRRLRLYVLIEGLAMAGIWLAAMFWIGLAIDYLPVLLGASEMPRSSRLVLLSLVMAVLFYIVFRWIFRRCFVRLSDRSMALLLERQFAGFRDSLVTVVELVGRQKEQPGLTQEMLLQSQQQALQSLRTVQLRKIFNPVPLVRKLILVVILAISLLGLAYLAGDSFFLAWKRLYLLSSEDWPRQTEIMIDKFHQGQLKVARGSNFSLRVFANAKKHVPDYCSVYYHTEQGDRGRVHMRRRGHIHRDRQEFVYDGVPFKSVLSSVRFDVLGFDHRLKNYELQVVDSPSLIEVQLNCTFPDYLVDEELGVFLPRSERLTPGTRLPIGTRILARATADKSLTRVTMLDTTSDNQTPWDVIGDKNSSKEFTHEITELRNDVSLAVTLHDIDGVSNDPPFRILIGALQDAVPQVAVNLRGIGSAITPQAQIPVQGSIADDNALKSAWFHLQQVTQLTDDNAPEGPKEADDNATDQSAIVLEHEFPITLQLGDEQQYTLDLREQQRERTGQFELRTGQRILLTIRATDRYNLDDKPRLGSSEVFDLEIVTPDQLIRRLETTEISLRRRLQQVLDELHSTRDSVVRVRSSFDDNLGSGPTGKEPNDTTAASDDPQRMESLRLLRVQRSIQDVLRSQEEVNGIGLAFEDICTELINNRVDTTERIQHLQIELANPLNEIAHHEYPPAVQTLKSLESSLDDPPSRITLANAAVQQLDEILLGLERILKQILELESYNELIDIVRSIIEDQTRLIEDTEKQRDIQGIELLK